MINYKNTRIKNNSIFIAQTGGFDGAVAEVNNGL
jgi:hypothetical protein